MALIDLPRGVTKRSIDTLISRRVNPFRASGVAVVCCVHGRVKRANADHFEVDMRRARPHLCPCCENFYAKPSDLPGPCPKCR